VTARVRGDANPQASASLTGLAWCLAGIVALGAASFAWLRPTNFRGYDEWVIVSLLSRGILSVPHANRPLNLIWHVPAWLIAPDRLWGFLLVHAAWLTASGVLTFLLVRRLLPGAGRCAFLAGALAVAWMPSEPTRVASVQMTLYSGCTAGALLATWLLVEAWHGPRPALLPAAALAAVATALSLEASLPILALAPLLLLFAGGAGRLGRRLLWTSGAMAFVAVLAARAALPLLTGRDALGYQLRLLSGTPSPWSVVRRIGIQLQKHLLPLATSPWRELLVPAVPVAVLVFALGFALATRAQSDAGDARRATRRAIACAGLVGLLHAVAGYWPMLMMRSARGIPRVEFLATPGVAVLLATAIMLATSALRGRLRHWVAGLLGAWVVAVGTGRTMAMQREWDSSVYARQWRTLEQLTVLAPQFAPHTFVVLLQEGMTWTFDFSFARAIDYLYEGTARGSVPGADSLLYETRYEQDGVVSSRAPVLRGPWGEETMRYRYDELVVFLEQRNGMLTVTDSWPEDLAPLPAGGAYSPRARILTDQPRPRRAAILDGR
jgi:hypothetical protein